MIEENLVEQLLDAWPASDILASSFGSSLSLASVDVLPSIAKKDIPGARKMNQGSRKQASNAVVESTRRLEKQIAFVIRQLRPETIITEGYPDRHSEMDCQSLVLSSRQIASDRSFLCFSKESGIPDLAWECKKVVGRFFNEERKAAEVQFASTTALKSNARLLGELMAPVPYLASPRRNQKSGSVSVYNQYRTLFGQRLTSNGKNEFVDDSRDLI